MGNDIQTNVMSQDCESFNNEEKEEEDWSISDGDREREKGNLTNADGP